MPKGVETKTQTRPAFRFVFEHFLAMELQAQYRIATEPCRPPAVVWQVWARWREGRRQLDTPRQSLAAGVTILGYDQFLIIPTRGYPFPPPCPKKCLKSHRISDLKFRTHFFQAKSAKHRKSEPQKEPSWSPKSQKICNKCYPDSMSKNTCNKVAKSMQKWKPAPLENRRFAWEGLQFHTFAASAKKLTKWPQKSPKMSLKWKQIAAAGLLKAMPQIC